MQSDNIVIEKINHSQIYHKNYSGLALFAIEITATLGLIGIIAYILIK